MDLQEEQMPDSIHDSIIATPMPQASSTVDKRTKYKTFTRLHQNSITTESTMQQGITAIEEMKKKLNIFSNYAPSDNMWENIHEAPCKDSSSSIPYFHKQITNLPGDSLFSLNDHSLAKKDLLMEDSGFTNIQNISDLERDEIYCRNSWGFIPPHKINMSLTAIENSKITPPDFMPVEDSLFSELQSNNCKDDIEAVMKYPPSKEEINRDLSLLKHDDTQVNKEIPSLTDIALALKSCKEDANPRKIMDSVLKAGEKKTSASEKPSINRKSNRTVKKSVEERSDLYDMEAVTPLALEEYLIWGNVQIGHCSKQIVHVIHKQEEQDTYKFEIEGDNAFKILVNRPKESSPSRSVFSQIKACSVFELQVIFSPNVIGQATGIIKIESQSKKTSKKVYLNGFCGKSKLYLHGIAIDPLSTSQHLTLSTGLKTTFKLENCGSTALFFYYNLGLLEEYCDIQPRLGVINPNEIIPIFLSLNLRQGIPSNWLSSCFENDLDIGKLILYFGEESTRLRLHNLSIKYEEAPHTKYFEKIYPFLNCNSFPSPKVDVTLLEDPKFCYADLVNDGIRKTEIGIKAGRDILLQTLDGAEWNTLKMNALDQGTSH